MPARAANWEKDIIANGVSMRTRRTGGAYTGPGSGRDAPEAGAPGPPPIGFMGGIPAPNCLPADALLAASERVLRTQGQAALRTAAIRASSGCESGSQSTGQDVVAS